MGKDHTPWSAFDVAVSDALGGYRTKRMTHAEALAQIRKAALEEGAANITSVDLLGIPVKVVLDPTQPKGTIRLSMGEKQ